MNLTQLKQTLLSIAGSWNGKESGLAEERALLAEDALEALEELKNLLVELDIK